MMIFSYIFKLNNGSVRFRPTHISQKDVRRDGASMCPAPKRGKFMKKLITAFFAILLMTSFAFANTYKVKKMTGKIYYGDDTPLARGDFLDDSTYVNIGVNRTITIRCVENNYEYTLGPMKKGTVKKLIDEKMNKANKVSIGASVTKSDVTDEDTKTTKGVATASSRASEAKQD